MPKKIYRKNTPDFLRFFKDYLELSWLVDQQKRALFVDMDLVVFVLPLLVRPEIFFLEIF